MPLVAAHQAHPRESTPMPANRPRAKHDEAYKLLFSSAAVVEGLLHHMLPEFAHLVDLPTLRKLSPSFVKAEALQQRHADMLWRARLRTPDQHPVYLSLEFQSAPVDNMAFRVYEYVGLMLREAELADDYSSADSRYLHGCESPIQSRAKLNPERGGRR